MDKLALAISSIEDPSDSRIEQNKPRVPSANSDVDSSDPDQDIWERVTGALAQTDCRELDPCAIEVVVNNGTVTLEGIVPSWAAMRAALDAARQTPGIRLRNGILLSP